MVCEYYRLLFAIDSCEKLLVWYSGDHDGVYTDSSGKIPTFPSVKALDAFAKTEGLRIEQESPILHNLDIVDKLISGLDDFTCNEIIESWNLFGDVAQSVGSLGKPFLAMDKSLNQIYDKVFFGCNLPSITPEGKFYVPVWSCEELKEIRELMNIGMSVFRNSIYNHDN